jgi:hypothetical protein
MRRAIAGPAAVLVAVTASLASGLPVRMVKLSGAPGRPEATEQLEFSRGLGFNALWVYGYQAGAWTRERAPRGPSVDPEFVTLARWCAAHGIELWVSINPVADSKGIVFSEPGVERRAVSFFRKLRAEAGVRHVVVSFDDQPAQLEDLGDIFRYGASAAPAHLDFVRRVAAGLPDDADLWLCSAAYCDAHLGNGGGPYAKALLAGLPSIPSRIGIVWTGPEVVSKAITSEGMKATRARLGGRRLLLYDNFPTNDDGDRDAMALILGALRSREAGLRDVVDAYLACPGTPAAGSRLSLMTIADWLRDPEGYDPDAAAARAIARLAGADPAALRALTTQQLEWGGFIGGRNYWPRDEMNPSAAGARLNDPAFVDSFTWTADRYPERIMALWGLADHVFRDELLIRMRRRLAVAQAMPLAVDYLALMRARRPEAGEVLARIYAVRSRWTGDADALRVLDVFLAAVRIPPAEGPR